MAKKVEDLDALVSTVQAAMRSHAALPAPELRLVRRHLGALRPRLEALGLEVTSQVRRPLEAQLVDVLSAGFVLSRGIEKRVAGASAKEVKAALQALVDGGRVREVVRASGPGVQLASQTDGALFEQAELAELLRHLGDAQRLVKRAIAKQGSRARPAVLRDDVMRALLDFGAKARPSASARRPLPESAAALPQTIRARVNDSGLPLRIPELLRALGVDMEVGKRALLAGAAAGLFGLEPESGMARLAPNDAAWCPEGPQGTRLSWVVARQEKGAGAR